jgi:hypothetical protein
VLPTVLQVFIRVVVSDPQELLRAGMLAGTICTRAEIFIRQFAHIAAVMASKCDVSWRHGFLELCLCYIATKSAFSGDTYAMEKKQAFVSYLSHYDIITHSHFDT